MPNRIELMLQQYLSPKLAKEAASKVAELLLVVTEKRSITAELMTAAKFDVLSHEVDKLIQEGHQVITIEGSKIL